MIGKSGEAVKSIEGAEGAWPPTRLQATELTEEGNVTGDNTEFEVGESHAAGDNTEFEVGRSHAAGRVWAGGRALRAASLSMGS